MTQPPSLYWLTRTRADVPKDSGWLTERECETLSGKQFLKRRADWRLGRWTAKNTVSAFFSGSSTPCAIREIEIIAAEDGAPEVFLAGRPAPIAISISHSAGVCLCVIRSDGGPVGCDIEVVEPRDKRLVSDYFSPEEIALLERHPTNDSPLLATLIWSAKESALKTIREGLRRDTRSVRVHVGALTHTSTWQPLTVVCAHTAKTYRGWWRVVDGFVHTTTADRPVDAPASLAGGRAGDS